MAQLVKNLPAVWETWVRSLGWEDPLEKNTPVFWPGEFHGLYSLWGPKESDMTEQLPLSKELLSNISLTPASACFQKGLSDTPSYEFNEPIYFPFYLG